MSANQEWIPGPDGFTITDTAGEPIDARDILLRLKKELVPPMDHPVVGLKPLRNACLSSSIWYATAFSQSRDSRQQEASQALSAAAELLDRALKAVKR